MKNHSTEKSLWLTVDQRIKRKWWSEREEGLDLLDLNQFLKKFLTLFNIEILINIFHNIETYNDRNSWSLPSQQETTKIHQFRSGSWQHSSISYLVSPRAISNESWFPNKILLSRIRTRVTLVSWEEGWRYCKRQY